MKKFANESLTSSNFLEVFRLPTKRQKPEKEKTVTCETIRRVTAQSN